jgi:hypothetical protein
MTETSTTYPTRAATESAVRSRFADIAAILGSAKTNAALYPEGLPSHIDRALRFSGTMASTLTPPEPQAPEEVVARLCTAVDAERDRRLALDFTYDFGETQAVDDSGGEIQAGERRLQMSPLDRSNWQTLQGAALTAVVGGAPETILPIRAEDNWNIQTNAAQVLQVLATMTAYGAALLFHGGALKSAIRAAEDPASVDILAGWPEPS